jgi:hypothetical protein
MPVDNVTGRHVLPEPPRVQNVATAVGIDDQTAAPTWHSERRVLLNERSTVVFR